MATGPTTGSAINRTCQDLPKEISTAVSTNHFHGSCYRQGILRCHFGPHPARTVPQSASLPKMPRPDPPPHAVQTLPSKAEQGLTQPHRRCMPTPSDGPPMPLRHRSKSTDQSSLLLRPCASRGEGGRRPDEGQSKCRLTPHLLATRAAANRPMTLSPAARSPSSMLLSLRSNARREHYKSD